MSRYSLHFLLLFLLLLILSVLLAVPSSVLSIFTLRRGKALTKFRVFRDVTSWRLVNVGKGSASILRIRQHKEGASRTQSPYGLHGKENLLGLTGMEPFVEQSLPSIYFTFLNHVQSQHAG